MKTNKIMEKSAVEWLEKRINTMWTPNAKELFEQAKEMEEQKLEQFYNHGQWAIIEHGHGDTFEDYYNKVFKQD